MRCKEVFVFGNGNFSGSLRQCGMSRTVCGLECLSLEDAQFIPVTILLLCDANSSQTFPANPCLCLGVQRLWLFPSFCFIPLSAFLEFCQLSSLIN